MNDENEFELNGKWYHAVPTSLKKHCCECALYEEHSLCFRSPGCNPSERRDRRAVVFVECENNGDVIRRMGNRKLASWLSRQLVLFLENATGCKIPESVRMKHIHELRAWLDCQAEKETR